MSTSVLLVALQTMVRTALLDNAQITATFGSNGKEEPVTLQ